MKLDDIQCSCCEYEENHINPDPFSKCGQCIWHTEEGRLVQALGFTNNFTPKDAKHRVGKSSEEDST